MRFLISIVAVTLAACSSEKPPAPAAATPAAALPAPAPAPVEGPALSADLVARLTRPHSPVLGAPTAKVTVVEVLDPACEACRAFAPIVKQLLFLYPDDVRVVVRYADFHPPSEEAIRALVAAQGQGKFDALLNALFERQEEWASHASPDPAKIWKIAGDAGLNVGKARKDAQAARVDELLRAESEDLAAIKVERTPTFFVNGKSLPRFGPNELLALVRSELGK